MSTESVPKKSLEINEGDVWKTLESLLASYEDTDNSTDQEEIRTTVSEMVTSLCNEIDGHVKKCKDKRYGEGHPRYTIALSLCERYIAYLNQKIEATSGKFSKEIMERLRDYFNEKVTELKEITVAQEDGSHDKEPVENHDVVKIIDEDLSQDIENKFYTEIKTSVEFLILNATIFETTVEQIKPLKADVISNFNKELEEIKKIDGKEIVSKLLDLGNFLSSEKEKLSSYTGSNEAVIKNISTLLDSRLKMIAKEIQKNITPAPKETEVLNNKEITGENDNIEGNDKNKEGDKKEEIKKEKPKKKPKHLDMEPIESEVVDMDTLGDFLIKKLKALPLNSERDVKVLHEHLVEILKRELKKLEENKDTGKIEELDKHILHIGNALDPIFHFKLKSKGGVDLAGDKLREEDVYKKEFITILYNTFRFVRTELERLKIKKPNPIKANQKLEDGKTPRPETPETPQNQTPAAQETPKPEQKPATLQDMLETIIDTNTETLHISEEIKNDAGFNAWLERIARKNHKQKEKGLSSVAQETIEDWHERYTNRKEYISQVAELLKGKGAFESVFASFTTDEEKAFAKKEYIEKLEWELLIDGAAAIKKIENIQKAHEACLAQEAQIKKLQKNKQEIEQSLQNTTMRIRGDLAFDILHGPNSESEKVHDLTDFLEDISLNYKFYHGPIQGSEVDDYTKNKSMRNMFVLYEKSRKGTEDGHYHKEINWLGKIWNKVRPKATTHENYYDLNAFENTIRTLEELKLVPTQNTTEKEAKENMNILTTGLRSLQYKISVERKDLESAAKELFTEEKRSVFLKIYTTYIQNKGFHSSMQEKARASGNKERAFEGIDQSITKSKSDYTETIRNTEDALKGDNYEFQEFIRDTQQEFALDQLTKIGEELRRNKKDIKKLQVISARIHSINIHNPSEEVELAHRRVSLELSQACVSLAGNSKELLLAPNAIAHYEHVFQAENSDIDKATKKKYADEAIQLLQKTLEATGAANIAKQIELKRFIKYFEDKAKNIQ